MKSLAFALVALGALAACNTVEGVAEDVKQTSQAVRRAL
ncbi:MAG: entericidin [Pseudomonadota bacterium]